MALAVFLAAHGADKAEIKRRVAEHSQYALDVSVDDLRPHYTFKESCAGTVPPSIACFLEAKSFEQAIRLAISLGGDADTMACIAGSIAAPFYGRPEGDRSKSAPTTSGRLAGRGRSVRGVLLCGGLTLAPNGGPPHSGNHPPVREPRAEGETALERATK